SKKKSRISLHSRSGSFPPPSFLLPPSVVSRPFLKSTETTGSLEGTASSYNCFSDTEQASHRSGGTAFEKKKTQFSNLALFIYRNERFHRLESKRIVTRALALASFGVITSLVAQHMYSLPVYAFIEQDFTTQAASYTHHQYIAGFIMTGAFAHGAIFFIRDYNPEQNEDNVLARMLDHKEAIARNM
ncbi:hypothetical protein F8388_003101, partial [Cannabis sativa]